MAHYHLSWRLILGEHLSAFFLSPCSLVLMPPFRAHDPPPFDDLDDDGQFEQVISYLIL
jgi:hypothetical protein